MSRFKRFAHSLASGYVLLGANMLYTLASVPLALKYLGNAEFGLWALATKLGGFIALVDFGLSASVARILIDHKDDRANGGYGSIIKTGLLVGAAQGVLVFLAGLILACYMGPWLDVRASLQPTLKWLLIGQCSLMAVSFSTKTFSHLLTAHQRFDITNYAQTVLFAVGFVVMWFGFAHGQGVYSILWAYAATTFPVVVVNLVSCVRLRLLPHRGEWGEFTWARFKDVFAFGNDIFIFALGAQLITASQTVLLTRFIGLETVAVWSVFTRIFDVLLQIVYRIFDYSSSALAEMIVRGEKKLLAIRFRQIVILSASLSLAAGTIFALCNQPFVHLWTSGRFDKPALQAADIKEPRQLAARLQSLDDVTAQFVWQQFLPTTREQIIKLAADETASGTLQTNLANELNRLLHGEPFTNQIAFPNGAHFTAIPPLSPTPTDALASAWFNRHVLEDAFPLEIADSRKTRWPLWNDMLLAFWLVLCASIHAHTGLVGQTKNFGFMRYIFFLEGLVFVGLTAIFHQFGITGMLCLSIGCSLAFSFSFGLWRTHRYFNQTWAELRAWHHAPLRLALWLLPAALIVKWLGLFQSPLLQLTLGAGLAGAWALVGFLRYGLETTMQEELLRRMPARAKGWLSRLMGKCG